MELEKMWYEASPFIYIATGGFLLGRGGSVLLMVSGILLLTAGGTIMAMRRRYALQTRPQKEKEKSAPRRR
jgi:hypothetical protein